MKKISRFLIMLLALVLAAAGAYAEMPTWQEVGTMVAPLERDHGYFDTWDLETKMQLIELLENLGELYDIDEVGVLLGEEHEKLTDEERNTLCDQIMAKFVGGPVEAVTLNSILETIHGTISSWTMQDRKWYSELLKSNNILTVDDKNYVLPRDNELSQEKATERALNFLASIGAEYLSDCQIDATLSEEQETTYNDGVLVTVQGRRLWTIVFDPGRADMVNNGICTVYMLADGPIAGYTVPELNIMHMYGLLPAADGISREEILASARIDLSERLSIPEDDLPNLKVYFGYINEKDEVVTHAGYGQKLWAVHCGLHAYCLLSPEGKVLYTGSYDPVPVQ